MCGQTQRCDLWGHTVVTTELYLKKVYVMEKNILLCNGKKHLFVMMAIHIMMHTVFFMQLKLKSVVY